MAARPSPPGKRKHSRPQIIASSGNHRQNLPTVEYLHHDRGEPRHVVKATERWAEDFSLLDLRINVVPKALHPNLSSDQRSPRLVWWTIWYTQAGYPPSPASPADREILKLPARQGRCSLAAPYGLSRPRLGHHPRSWSALYRLPVTTQPFNLSPFVADRCARELALLVALTITLRLRQLSVPRTGTLPPNAGPNLTHKAKR